MYGNIHKWKTLGGASELAPDLSGRLMLEVPSDRDPREIHIEIQDPAYYLGIKFFIYEEFCCF